MARTQSYPLISVVVPVYNAEKFLHICLEYLVHQTYPNLEFIIVDDGSTDNTPEIYKNYAKHDKRFKIIRQDNSGPANARNNGLAYASGEYIHFHDSDDFVEQDYYEKIFEAIKLSDADIICGEVKETGYMFPVFDRVHILTTMEEKNNSTKSQSVSCCMALCVQAFVPEKTRFKIPNKYVYRRRYHIYEQDDILRKINSHSPWCKISLCQYANVTWEKCKTNYARTTKWCYQGTC